MSEAHQFNGFIGPDNLLGLVRNTAPFLFSPDFAAAMPADSAANLCALGAPPLGWLNILRNAQRLAPSDAPDANARADYFALCLACHMATVATFVPTDVDTKIRGALWNPAEPREILRRMGDLALQAKEWDLRGISARVVMVPGFGPVSGHDGEMLGVMLGALGGFTAAGDEEYAQRFLLAIEAELEREAAAFRQVATTRDQELELLRLAAILTHNVGDVDQGLSSWPAALTAHPHRQRLGRLAHENATPFGGTYQIAAHLYKQLLAAEGHRHYPLRAIKALRKSAALLLPIGPFFDSWGETVANHPDLNADERAEIAAALITGCRKVPNQAGYQRALAGMDQALGGIEQLTKRLPGAARQALKDVELRRAMAVKRISFESGLRKRASAALAEARRRA